MISEIQKRKMLRSSSDSLISLSRFSVYPKITHCESVPLSEILSDVKEVRTLELYPGIMIFIEYRDGDRLTILNMSECQGIGKNSILRITEYTRIVSDTDTFRILEEVRRESRKKSRDFSVVRIFQDYGTLAFEENGERIKNTDDAALQTSS